MGKVAPQVRFAAFTDVGRNGAAITNVTSDGEMYTWIYPLIIKPGVFRYHTL